MRMRWIAGAALLAVLHTAAEEAAEPELLNVLSYNIQSRPVLDKSAEKNPQIGRRLTAFDLVGVQELFVGDGEFFRNTGGMAHVYFGKKRHAFKLVNSGLAVLAKCPAETSATEYFEDEGSLENRLGSKGILMVRYRIGGEPLDFYTTHLAAGTEEESGESRRNQVRQIIRFIKKHSPDGNAVILCGDFNLRLDKLGTRPAQLRGGAGARKGGGDRPYPVPFRRCPETDAGRLEHPERGVSGQGRPPVERSSAAAGDLPAGNGVEYGCVG